METHCVFFAIWAESLNIIWMIFSLKWLIEDRNQLFYHIIIHKIENCFRRNLHNMMKTFCFIHCLFSEECYEILCKYENACMGSLSVCVCVYMNSLISFLYVKL
jgi:hypothetical protein